MSCKGDRIRSLPIPARDAPGMRFLRDGFIAAYLFKEDENRLFLLDRCDCMTEICSQDLRDVILAIGVTVSRGEALQIPASERQAAAAAV